MIITACTVFVVLPPWQEFTQFLWWIQTAGVEPSQPDWAVSSPVGCRRPCLPSLFVIKYWKLLLTVCCEISWTKTCVVSIAQHHWVIAQRRWVVGLHRFIVLFFQSFDTADWVTWRMCRKTTYTQRFSCGNVWRRTADGAEPGTHTIVLRPFSGTTRVSWCQKKSSFGFYGARGDRYQRQTNRQSGSAPLHPDYPSPSSPHVYAGCPSCYNPPNLSWLGTGTKYAGLRTRWRGLGSSGKWA